jgi:hypothetical protein
MRQYQIAQVNIGRVKAPLDHVVMAGFVERLDELNALADGSPGFVWRLQTPQGNATYLRPYDDDRILINLSVWETVEALREYVYRSRHGEMLRQRQNWFDPFARAFLALWWVPAGHVPGIDEARRRLAYLDAHGPTQFAFTFRAVFEPTSTGTNETVMLDLLEWVARRQTSYDEVMEVWRTSCPRFPAWEDANDLGLIKAEEVNGRSMVRVTALGLALLKQRRSSTRLIPSQTAQK